MLIIFALLLAGCGEEEGLVKAFQAFDGLAAADHDGDGYTSDVDCDDTNPDVHPDATEIWYDGIDQACDDDGDDLADFDADADGYPWPQGEFPEAYLHGYDLDCDDGDATVNPGADNCPWGNGGHP